MFTGLVQKKGKIVSPATLFVVEATPWDTPFIQGESIAVNGVCLTLTRWQDNFLHFDLLDETLKRTNLGAKTKNQTVNLERALRVGEALGGHFVTGHVDEVGTVVRFEQQGNDRILEIACSSNALQEMVIKGSITCDGVSLTIVELKPESFTVHLIPHTYQSTSLGELKAGDGVNLETDILAKHVRRLMGEGSRKL